MAILGVFRPLLRVASASISVGFGRGRAEYDGQLSGNFYKKKYCTSNKTKEYWMTQGCMLKGHG